MFKRLLGGSPSSNNSNQELLLDEHVLASSTRVAQQDFLRKPGKTFAFRIRSETYYDAQFNRLFWTSHVRETLVGMGVQWDYDYSKESLVIKSKSGGTTATAVNLLQPQLLSTLEAMKRGAAGQDSDSVSADQQQQQQHATTILSESMMREGAQNRTRKPRHKLNAHSHSIQHHRVSVVHPKSHAIAFPGGRPGGSPESVGSSSLSSTTQYASSQPGTSSTTGSSAASSVRARQDSRSSEEGTLVVFSNSGSHATTLHSERRPISIPDGDKEDKHVAPRQVRLPAPRQSLMQLVEERSQRVGSVSFVNGQVVPGVVPEHHAPNRPPAHMQNQELSPSGYLHVSPVSYQMMMASQVRLPSPLPYRNSLPVSPMAMERPYGQGHGQAHGHGSLVSPTVSEQSYRSTQHLHSMHLPFPGHPEPRSSSLLSPLADNTLSVIQPLRHRSASISSSLGMSVIREEPLSPLVVDADSEQREQGEVEADVNHLEERRRMSKDRITLLPPSNTSPRRKSSTTTINTLNTLNSSNGQWESDMDGPPSVELDTNKDKKIRPKKTKQKPPKFVPEELAEGEVEVVTEEVVEKPLPSRPRPTFVVGSRGSRRKYLHQRMWSRS